jgi:hypothetical protein
MRRHLNLVTFLVSLPFVAFLPILFPDPRFDAGQTLVAVAYLAAALAMSRLIAIGITRLPFRRLRRQKAHR